MANLPSFEEIRADMFRRLGDVLDVARSDWRAGAGPTKRQAAALARARRHIVAAKVALDAAAK
jgi:hypothetical protein